MVRIEKKLVVEHVTVCRMSDGSVMFRIEGASRWLPYGWQFWNAMRKLEPSQIHMIADFIDTRR